MRAQRHRFLADLISLHLSKRDGAKTKEEALILGGGANAHLKLF